jgi:hypothetical protein
VAPVRLIAVFVGVLVMALVVAGAIALAVKTPAKAPICPDPTQACGAPPIAASFEPIARSSPTPAATPRPTIVRPAGTVPPVASTPAPTAALTPSPSPTPSPSASTGAVPQNPSVVPVAVPIGDLPSPSPGSSAEPFQAGVAWTSTTYGYSLEYDGFMWLVERQDAANIILSAGDGALVVFVEGFNAKTGSTQQLVQSGVDGLKDLVLGLAEEDDPERQLPGRPIVGHRPGVGALLNGTLNSPQGPTTDVALVVLASTDDTISIRVTVLVNQAVRDRGFSVADSLLNSISWPERPQ